ncbi:MULTISPECIES: histidine phosphatase family protein [Microbacterium]|uniref:histidine phosphatase family protein n=1 Tax=Microbacterium TaxID=33882 RepID=UPI00217CC70B|nr:MULTISPECIES: histidine phosphatase family protein [Microbacterium]UWF77832.1 histidine phosphatase family protein [Microbacterium neungamense]WCM56008.1 histidine phosphatase family protein [Microbacterium sp. EF45047]
MPASRLHLVRHGEVHNPDRVLYGRLPDYHLSAAGQLMAKAAAEYVLGLGRPIAELRTSPLERTRESVQPFMDALHMEAVLDPRLLEPTNVFEGTRMRRALRDPRNWRHLRRPSIPSWGEPYASIVARMRAVMDERWDAVPSGDLVFVSHQAPIWITHLAVAGLPLRHDPRTRRCALSSVTSFVRDDDGWHEVGYAEPAAGGVDLGAV